MHYLDHAATTPMLPEALEVMSAHLHDLGNPSSLHAAGRAARRTVEEARERLGEALGARPSEIVFTGGGTEADNLAVKGLYWSRRPRTHAGFACSPAQSSTTPCSTPCAWLGAHQGAQIEWLPVDRLGRLDLEALEDVDRQRPGLGRVGRRDVGQQRGRHGAADRARWWRSPVATASRCTPTPCRRPLQLEVDFTASGLTTHGGQRAQDRRPARRRRAARSVVTSSSSRSCTVAARSATSAPGTLDAPAIAGFAVAAEIAVARREVQAKRLAGLRDDLIAGVLAAVPDAVLNGDPGPEPHLRLPANAHFAFPGCEGDALLMLLDANGIACSTGSACSAGVAQPSHVLLAMGLDPDLSRSSLRFSLGHTSTDADVAAVVEAIGPAVERARNAQPRRGGEPITMRVLAAMSGGVDSAVAAARAVDAGHDVTGVHLALAENPKSFRTGARGCCTLEDARDARRAADVLGIPFYVWDLAERFREDVVDDFVAEYAAGRTPNPCLRCNEKIKFSAVLDRALALGFDAVVTGHHARLEDGVLRRSVDAAKDQSYVLAVLTRDQLAHAIFPLGGSTKAEVRAEAATPRARGRREAGQPRHLLHRRRRHRRLPARPPRVGAW